MAISRLFPALAGAALVLALGLGSSVHAGAVLEIETSRGGESETVTLSAQGENLKIDVRAGAGSDDPDEIIFRGESGEMIVIDHDQKSYLSIGDEQLEALRSMMPGGDGATSLMEQALAGVPPEQRAMVERMMRERMQAAGQAPPSAPSAPMTDYRNTGERAERAGYPSVKYEGLRDGEVVRELWISDWERIEGGAELRAALGAWSEFWNDAFSRVTGSDPFEIFTRAEGFPVQTRELEGGEVESETVLQSASERDLEPSVFEAPPGYEPQSLGL